MLPAAASTAAAVPAHGEPWRVLGAFPTAVYLGGPDRAVLPIVAADGLVLPNAWRLPYPSLGLSWGVAPGDEVTVERLGVLEVGAHRIRRVRTWAPRPVQRVAPSRIGVDGVALAAHIGQGPGLTPEGDDVACGALLVAHAVGDLRLRAALAPAFDTTTDLSASLLHCAGDGLAVPQLVAFVDALLAGDLDLAASRRSAVLGIGHSSGPALVRGVEEALASLAEGEPARV